MSLDVSDAHAERMALGLLGGLSSFLTDKLAETFFGETGPFAREFYPKHIEAMGLTKEFDVSSIFGGNRTGKTTAEAFMAYVWSTGLYPPWWPGHVFPKHTRGWVSSQTSATVTNGLQRYLIGPEGRGGMIPRDSILHVEWAPNTLGMAHRVLVRHEPTGLGSEIFFKTYDMGRKRLQSDTIDWGIMDEEPPAPVYSEVITRMATTNGKAVIGFTALEGVTPLVAHLLPEYASGNEAPEDEEPTKRAHVFIGWADIPYAQLSKKRRETLAKNYLPHERQARMAGIPQMGTGLVYPAAEEQFIVPAFVPPSHWPRICAVDPGGTPRGDGRTAGLWCAYDKDSDCLYAYSEYYEKFSPIPSHVHAFARRGNWVPMIIDPAGANVTDGKGVYAEYVAALHELNENWTIHKADKRFSLGRAELFDRMTSGRFKVMDTLRNTLAEHRSYVIKENGDFVGAHHLWDCARYIARKPGLAALPPRLTKQQVVPEQRYF